MDMHKDVLASIYHFQLEVLRMMAERGEKITAEQMSEALFIGLSTTHKQFVDMAEKCESNYKTIQWMQREFSRERRIAKLFLDNHNLYYEYEMFEARILERIFDNEDRAGKVTA